ncbi:MAG TPA: hypothetical protein VFA19_03295 [Gaiellaceae bacterium]|nr:hypothetical protein [Gaiellaceae bacterium]
MELNEAVRRIFLQHRLLIAIAVLAGAAIGVALAVGSKGYTASTRMVIDSQDPKARAESTAIADTARAIATSPSLVRKALADAGVTGKSIDAFATNDISVNTLGTSGVIELSVTDGSRRVAATVANALAQEVIRTRLEIATGLARQTQAAIAGKVTDLDQRIARLDSTLASLNVQLARGGVAQAAALQARIDQLSRLRDFLTQQRGVLETQQAGLLTSSSVGPMPSVISAATAANATAVTSPYRSDGVLGGLLGLILGLAFAVLAESVRPTLAGGAAVARELGTAHLGTYAVDGETGAVDGAVALTHDLKEAAVSAQVRKVDLLGAVPGLELGPLAKALEAATAKATARDSHVHVSGPSSIVVERQLRIRPVGPQNLTEGRETGLVVIAPATLKKTQLNGIAELIRVTRSPLLGVITFKPAQRWWAGIVPERHAAVSAAKAVKQT